MFKGKGYLRKLLPFLALFVFIFVMMCVSTSAAEEFYAEEIELSSSSPKDIQYNIKAKAATAFWSANFTVGYDSDVVSLVTATCNPAFKMSYTDNGSEITFFLYRVESGNASLKKGDTLVSLSFKVSDKILPGAYSLTFTPKKNSIVKYNGTVLNLHVSGGTLFYGNKVTYISNGKTLSSDYAAEGDVLYPIQDHKSLNPDELFLGWYSKKSSQHDKIFIAPGESFTLGNYDLTLEAVFLEIKTLPGASVYFSNENNDVRLRYISAVNKQQYEFVYNEILGGDAASLILGTLICPTKYAENNAEFGSNNGMDFGALKNDRLAVQTSVPKAPGIWLSDADIALLGGNASKYYYYEGILSNILREGSDSEVIDCNTSFSAVAYMTLTYPDGTTIDYFAKYDAENHSRSVSYVVDKALGDVSDVQTNYYKFKIDGVYRPYSSSQIESLYKLKAARRLP